MGTNYNVKLEVLTANYKTRSEETLCDEQRVSLRQHT